jgi:hypothetical protein
LRDVEASRQSEQGGAVRARIYNAVAAASELERTVVRPQSPAPALTEQLRERMEEVRGRLHALADAAAPSGPPATDPTWPPPDPRDAVPAPPPSAATVTVREDLLQRIRIDLVATRALIVRTSTALARSEADGTREAPDARPVQAPASG